MALTVDLNADLGEECGDDAAMLEIVSSANIACGLHAGGPLTLARTVEAARAHGVVFGAHPSYPDRENFGRTSMAMPSRALFDVLNYQLGAFAAVTEEPIAYIKAHGALYNDAARNHPVAERLVMASAARRTALMHQPGNTVHWLSTAAEVPFIAEVFADRAYKADGTLAPRSMEGAVLHDSGLIAERVVRMVGEGTVETIDGGEFAFADVHSVCVHGDTPGAVNIARTVRSALEAAGVTVAAPARDAQ